MKRDRVYRLLREIGDKQLVKKTQLAKLSQEEEIAKNKSSLASIAVTELYNKEIILTKEVEELGNQLVELQKEINNIVDEGLSFITQIEKTIDDYLNCLEKLNQKVSDEENVLIQVKKEEREAHQRIVNEEKILGGKQRDYGIYKERLEKKYLELFPDTRLTL